jgi:sugar fermentation stimulation protein A
MRFSSPLVPGRLVQRYKRFLSDHLLESGEAVTAHCANPGAMLGLAAPGARVWLSRSADPRRKLAHSWEMVEADGTLVGINTSHPNRLVEAAIRDGTLAELAGYASLKAEVKYGRNSRIDLMLEDAGRGRAYVEVKNVHLLRRLGLAEFPDCVTARGAKHLEELGDQVAEGHRAVMVYLVQRADVDRFALAADLDPAYARAFERAMARGVEAVAYACRVTPEEIAVERRIPLA